MVQDQNPVKPSQPDPAPGGKTGAGLKEPSSPGQPLSGLSLPGNKGKKNAGHTNPAHNTPGHTRQDQPGQQETGQPGQDQTQSYPGIKGPKVRDLEQDSGIDKEQAKRGAEDIRRAVKPGAATADDDALDMPKE